MVLDSDICPCSDEILEGVEEFVDREPNPANRLTEDGEAKLDLLLLVAREATSSNEADEANPRYVSLGVFRVDWWLGRRCFRAAGGSVHGNWYGL